MYVFLLLSDRNTKFFFQTEGFDFGVLQFLEEMLVNSPDCEDQKLIVKRLVSLVDC